MKKYLEEILNHEYLSREETRDILINITQEKYPGEQLAALMSMLQLRGITVDELLGFRDGILETGLSVKLDADKYVDIVGTGGDMKNTFNISTCACAVVAGAGYNVAKHGNFASTSTSGASDVMARHGVQFTFDPDRLNRSMEQTHLVYLHAQVYARAMKFVGPVRKVLPFMTFFNLLGPLVNPSQPKCNVMGTATLEQMRLYNNVFQKMGVDYALVNSTDGYDEISLTGTFKVNTNKYEKVFDPSDFGLPETKDYDLFGGRTPQEAAAIFDSVLENTATEGQKNTVLANAAVAIQCMDQSLDILDALAIARESLESGKALANFKKFVELNS